MADKKAILLRISPDLWEHLNRWARDDIRSVNAQIEYILREAVRKRMGKPLPPDDSPRPPDDESVGESQA